MRFRLPLTVGFLLSLVTGIAGCGLSESGDPNKPVAVRTVDEVDAATKKLSSELRDIIAVKGKVTEPGPGVSGCPPGSKTNFQMRHSWAVYDAPAAIMEPAMERLHEQLPNRDWEIVSYGPNSSRDRNIEIMANHHGRKFSLNAVLSKSGENGKKRPRLVVTVVSACYQVPEGQEVDRY